MENYAEAKIEQSFGINDVKDTLKVVGISEDVIKIFEGIKCLIM